MSCKNVKEWGASSALFVCKASTIGMRWSSERERGTYEEDIGDEVDELG